MKAKRGGRRATAFWEGTAGWKAVDVGDDLLLGSEEFGFAGLEELDPKMLGGIIEAGPSAPGPAPAAAVKGQHALLGANTQGDAAKQQGHHQKQLRKRQKRKQAEAAGSAPASEALPAAGPQSEEESLEALRAKVARLERENKRLKGGSEGGRQAQRESVTQGRAVAAAGEGEGATESTAVGQEAEGGQQGGEFVGAALAGRQPVASGAAAESTAPPGREGKKAAKKAARLAARLEAKQRAKADKAARQQAKRQQQQQEQQQQEQLADVSAWRPYELHPLVEQALGRLGFSEPTKVQAECIPAAVRDRRDVIGAAQTGSGKTLAFGLPIMQLLLAERDEQAQQAGYAEQARQRKEGRLRALILAPTRELAMQVCEHLQAVGRTCGIWVVPIVGGISAQKQERMLSRRPEVVVATPGRLWDLMKLGQDHVSDLSRLSFLVIDEADRMVQQGHYQELTDILAAIPHPGAQHQAAAAAEEEAEELPAIDDPKSDASPESDGAGEGLSGDGQEERVEGLADDVEHEVVEGEEGQLREPRPRLRRPRRHLLQTFVFSATLTLPAALRKRLRKGGGGAAGSASLDSLMDRVPFRPKPKIVDLTSQRKLADKVEEAYIECGESERDEYLYCILAKHPGRTLVFVNAISSVRRLGAILKLLGLPAHALHAGMQQRARLKALDRFKSDLNAILVATDVAARGLDVKDVRCVIHYQIPASVDVYVHRSGRTARAEAEGVSIALVTPKESARFLALLRALGRQPPPEFPVDLSLMPAAHKRVRLAVRLDDLARRQSKSKADASWRRQNAEALGIVLSDDDDDEEEEGVQGRRVGRKAQRDKGGARGPDDDATTEELRAELSTLLSEPLQPAFSRKYFTGGAAAAVAAHLAPGGGAGGAAGRGKETKQRQQQQRNRGGAADAAGDGLENGDGVHAEPAEHAPAGAAATVSSAVQLAQAMASSRAKAAADVKQKAAKKKSKANRKDVDPRQAALKAALAKHGAKKRGGAGRGLFVVPQAFGREVAGPDALQALRSKLAAV